MQEFIRNANAIDTPQEELTKKDRLKFAWEQVLGTAKKVAPYVLIGVGIGAFIHNWIPEDIIVKVLGLLAKGTRLGVVLSFMMGVTTLSLPSIIMLKKAVKTKLLAIFVAICAIGIIVVGYFFNAIQYLLV